MPSRGIHGNRPVALVRRSTFGGAVDVVRNGLNGEVMRRIAAKAAPTEKGRPGVPLLRAVASSPAFASAPGHAARIRAALSIKGGGAGR